MIRNVALEPINRPPWVHDEVEGEEEEEEEEEEKEVNLPIGYRFCPTEVELITYYLLNKVLDRQFPLNIIKGIDLYNYDPDHLPIDEFNKYGNDNEAYYFTNTKVRYMNRTLASRTTKNGYWKATGGDVKVFRGKEIVGFKKILVFYWGKIPTGIKSQWTMHEYRLNPTIIPLGAVLNDHKKIERCVVCRIQNKGDGGQNGNS